MESGDIAKLADPEMQGEYDVEQLHRVVLTASYCVRQSSIWRPTMTEVHPNIKSHIEHKRGPFDKDFLYRLLYLILYLPYVGIRASNQWP